MKYGLVFLMSVLVMGCTSFDVAKPIYPEFSSGSVEVDSLRPTLKWEQKFEGPADLMLIEGDETVKFITGVMRGSSMSQQAKVLYVEENIVNASHEVKMDLKPNRYYFWAVRKHQEDGKDEGWSNYDSFVFFGIGYSYSIDTWFEFHTPKIEN